MTIEPNAVKLIQAEERIQALEAENAQLRAELAQAYKLLDALGCQAEAVAALPEWKPTVRLTRRDMEQEEVTSASCEDEQLRAEWEQDPTGKKRYGFC